MLTSSTYGRGVDEPVRTRESRSAERGVGGGSPALRRTKFVTLYPRATAKEAPMGIYVKQGMTYPEGDVVPRSLASIREKSKSGTRSVGARSRL